MPAMSESLTFHVTNTATVELVYPNTATGAMIYTSDKLKGDGYFGSCDGLHTVMYTTAVNFFGTVKMQASLATEPAETDWFDVVDTSVTYTEFDSRNTSSLDYFNFTGNFVWIRGHVSISSGAVESIRYNH